MYQQGTPDNYIPRLIEERLRASVDKPVVTMIAGARQVGKSTLLMRIMEWVKKQYERQSTDSGFVLNRRVFSYTLDDIQLRASLKKDITFIEKDVQLSLGTGLNRLNERIFILIDEIQKFPQLLDWVKQVYDSNSKFVKFIVTGSSVAGFNKKLTETLAGRVEYLYLYPVNYTELYNFRKGVNTGWLIPLLSGLGVTADNVNDLLAELDAPKSDTQESLELGIRNHLKNMYLISTENPKETSGILLESIFYGGLPKIFQAPLSERIEIIRNYVSVYLEKEISFIARNLDLELFGLSLSAFAKQSGELLNIQKVSQEVGVARPSLYRYLDLLENTFLVKRVYPYIRGKVGGKTATKSVVLYFIDSGLLNVLSGINSVSELFSDPNRTVRAVGAMILNQLLTAFGFLKNPPQLHYWSDYEGHRVDFVFDYMGYTFGFIFDTNRDARKVAKTKEKFLSLVSNPNVVLMYPELRLPSPNMEYEVNTNKVMDKSLIEVRMPLQLFV